MKHLYSYYATEFLKDGRPNILPTSVEIDLTNSCNQDCTYCITSDFRKEKPGTSAALEDFILLIDRLAEWNVDNSTGRCKTITFVGGGEPTLFPKYELIVKHAIDRGFITAMVTNGTYLERLALLGEEYVKKIAWIGVDIDSGLESIFDSVRRPKKANQFEKVKKNIELLVGMGAVIDIKALLLTETATKENIVSLFELCEELHVRMLYYRLAFVSSGLYKPSEELITFIDETSKNYTVNVRVNVKRGDPRKYTKCFALYLLPIFTADGSLYLCCEYRGKKELKLCNWLDEDFRTQWLSEKHHKIHDELVVSKCHPCRQNPYNNGIQDVIDDPESLEGMFF